MNRNLLYIIVFALTSCVLALSACGTDPEDILIGSWQEKGGENIDMVAQSLSQNHEHIIKSHKTEEWNFYPDHRFKIKLADSIIEGKWSILGRGHILKFYYDHTGDTEVFDIKELNEDELILSIDIGMELRGAGNLYLGKNKKES